MVNFVEISCHDENALFYGLLEITSVKYFCSKVLICKFL